MTVLLFLLAFVLGFVAKTIIVVREKPIARDPLVCECSAGTGWHP